MCRPRHPGYRVLAITWKLLTHLCIFNDYRLLWSPQLLMTGWWTAPSGWPVQLRSPPLVQPSNEHRIADSTIDNHDAAPVPTGVLADRANDSLEDGTGIPAGIYQPGNLVDIPEPASLSHKIRRTSRPRAAHLRVSPARRSTAAVRSQHRHIPWSRQYLGDLALGDPTRIIGKWHIAFTQAIALKASVITR